MAPLRVIFMGTAELARTSLEALAQADDFILVAVVTQPDRPRGRELKVQASPVKEAALRRRLPVLQPQRARDESFVSILRGWQPDLIAVAAYGQILPPSILDLPRHGCLNVHTSLLPKYRGAAPIQWALLDGEPETGVTIMKMDAGLDTGGILSQRSTPIQTSDDAKTLHDRLAAMGAELLTGTIRDYVAGKLSPHPQPAEGASYARKIRKEDGLVPWNEPARKIWNRVRALAPWPGAFSHLPATPPQLLKIWQAETVSGAGHPGEIIEAGKAGIVVACGEGCLRILVLQREGGRRLTAQQFLSGHELKPGMRLVL